MEKLEEEMEVMQPLEPSSLLVMAAAELVVCMLDTLRDTLWYGGREYSLKFALTLFLSCFLVVSSRSSTNSKVSTVEVV